MSAGVVDASSSASNVSALATQAQRQINELESLAQRPGCTPAMKWFFAYIARKLCVVNDVYLEPSASNVLSKAEFEHAQRYLDDIHTLVAAVRTDAESVLRYGALGRLGVFVDAPHAFLYALRGRTAHTLDAGAGGQRTKLAIAGNAADAGRMVAGTSAAATAEVRCEIDALNTAETERLLLMREVSVALAFTGGGNSFSVIGASSIRMEASAAAMLTSLIPGVTFGDCMLFAHAILTSLGKAWPDEVQGAVQTFTAHEAAAVLAYFAEPAAAAAAVQDARNELRYINHASVPSPAAVECVVAEAAAPMAMAVEALSNPGVPMSYVPAPVPVRPPRTRVVTTMPAYEVAPIHATANAAAPLDPAGFAYRGGDRVEYRAPLARLENEAVPRKYVSANALMKGVAVSQMTRARTRAATY